ncbi:unnamed protein product [Ixodes pacificus]
MRLTFVCLRDQECRLQAQAALFSLVRIVKQASDSSTARTWRVHAQRRDEGQRKVRPGAPTETKDSHRHPALRQPWREKLWPGRRESVIICPHNTKPARGLAVQVKRHSSDD